MLDLEDERRPVKFRGRERGHCWRRASDIGALNIPDTGACWSQYEAPWSIAGWLASS